MEDSCFWKYRTWIRGVPRLFGDIIWMNPWGGLYGSLLEAAFVQNRTLRIFFFLCFCRQCILHFLLILWIQIPCHLSEYQGIAPLPTETHKVKKWKNIYVGGQFLSDNVWWLVACALLQMWRWTVRDVPREGEDFCIVEEIFIENVHDLSVRDSQKAGSWVTHLSATVCVSKLDICPFCVKFWVQFSFLFLIAIFKHG